MARLNPNYGSELHLLRMLGRHRDYFSRKVCEATGVENVEWLDFPSGEKRQEGNEYVWDREWQHLRFLPPTSPARKAWSEVWPQSGSGQNWDAIGRVKTVVGYEWLLVEAKANVRELKSQCAAENPDSRATIERVLDATKSALGVTSTIDWTRPYYQFCNRLVVLHVLNAHGAPARLLYVYFCGDVGNQGRACPESEAGWKAALAEQEERVGLPAGHVLQGRVHKVFVDVQCLE